MNKNKELLKGVGGMAASLKDEQKSSIKKIKEAELKHGDPRIAAKGRVVQKAKAPKVEESAKKKIGRPSVRQDGVRYKRLSIDIPVETFQKLKLAMGHEKNFERQQWEVVDELINKGINTYL